MKYRTTKKQSVYKQNAQVEADGFGSWGVLNLSEESEVIIDDFILLKPRDSFSFTLQPECKYENSIVISFPETTETNNVLVFRMYHTPQPD